MAGPFRAEGGEAAADELRPAHRAAAGLPARFDAHEIHSVREFDGGGGKYCEQQVPEEEAEFWSLYGHVPGEGVICIGDFQTRQFAEEIYARMTGAPYR